MPVLEPLSYGVLLGQEFYEGIGAQLSGPLDFGTIQHATARRHQDHAGLTLNGGMILTPGECVGASLYFSTAPTNGELDEFGTYGTAIKVSQADRTSLPERTTCNYSASSSVPESCMWYGRITNRGATGAIEVDLDNFKVGMDFIAVNEAGYSFSVDPATTPAQERFLYPATNADGDKLTSLNEGNYFHAFSPLDGKARVTTSSGFSDDD
jgi:hypothetical protein